MDDISYRIRRFIGTELLAKENASAVTEETKLLRGVTDSLGIMRLVVFLQEEFNLTFSEAEVDPGHFRTVADLEKLVRHRLAEREEMRPS
jgi:acyl carrier protein